MTSAGKAESLSSRANRARSAAERGLASVSRNLSVVAVLACFTLPLLPHVTATFLQPAAAPSLATAEPPENTANAKPRPNVESPPPPAPAVVIVKSRPVAGVDPGNGLGPETDLLQPIPEPVPDKLRAKKTAPPPPPAAAVEPPKAEAPPTPAAPAAWSESEVAAALKACVQMLGPVAADVEPLPAMKHDQCGAAAPVLLKRIGSGATAVDIQPPATLNCAMVAKLAKWVDHTLQPAAKDTLGSGVTRLNGVSGYVCRGRNGDQTSSGKLSEHALANAIDITSFTLSDGRLVDVGKHWGPTRRDKAQQPPTPVPTEAQRKFVVKPGSAQAVAAPASAVAPKGLPAEPEARFLRRLHEGACSMFGTVLGPEANEAHREHFHFDLHPRKASAFCQ